MEAIWDVEGRCRSKYSLKRWSDLWLYKVRKCTLPSDTVVDDSVRERVKRSEGEVALLENTLCQR